MPSHKSFLQVEHSGTEFVLNCADTNSSIIHWDQKGFPQIWNHFQCLRKNLSNTQSVHHHLPAACFEDGVNSLIQCPQLSNWTWCFLLQGISKCIQLCFDCFSNNMSETWPHLCWADFVTFAFQDFGCTQSFASNCVVGYTRTQWLIKASISPLLMAGVNFFPAREQAITEANLQLLSLCLQKLSPDAKNLANYYSLFHRFLWSLSFWLHTWVWNRQCVKTRALLLRSIWYVILPFIFIY